MAFEWIGNFGKYLTNKEVPFVNRIGSLLLGALLIFVADNVLGLSEFYLIKQKVSTISSIQTLLKDQSLDSGIRASLLKKEKQIASIKGYSDHLSDLAGNMNLPKKYSPSMNRYIDSIDSSFSFLRAFVSSNFIFLYFFMGEYLSKKFWTSEKPLKTKLNNLFGTLFLLLAYSVAINCFTSLSHNSTPTIFYLSNAMYHLFSIAALMTLAIVVDKFKSTKTEANK